MLITYKMKFGLASTMNVLHCCLNQFLQLYAEIEGLKPNRRYFFFLWQLLLQSQHSRQFEILVLVPTRLTSFGVKLHPWDFQQQEYSKCTQASIVLIWSLRPSSLSQFKSFPQLFKAHSTALEWICKSNCCISRYLPTSLVFPLGLTWKMKGSDFQGNSVWSLFMNASLSYCKLILVIEHMC